MIESSYAKNDYGHVLFILVSTFKPVHAIEIGVLHGYSTYHIARGFKSIYELEDWKIHFNAYDLWDEYSYNHGDINKVSQMLKEGGVDEYVTLHHGDIYKLYEEFEDEYLDFLHVDISNDGDILEFVMDKWHHKMMMRGIIVFEGGSEERDKVEWMIKHNKKPIKPVVDNNKVINSCYHHGTYAKFPSMTVMYRFA